MQILLLGVQSSLSLQSDGMRQVSSLEEYSNYDVYIE